MVTDGNKPIKIKPITKLIGLCKNVYVNIGEISVKPTNGWSLVVYGVSENTMVAKCFKKTTTKKNNNSIIVLCANFL